jgi:hypothetical protein
MTRVFCLFVLVLVSCGKREMVPVVPRAAGETPPTATTEQSPGVFPKTDELGELEKLNAVNEIVFPKYFREIQPGIQIYKSELTPEPDILDFLSQAQGLLARLENTSFPAGSTAINQVVALYTTVSRAKDTVRLPYSAQTAAANNALYLVESAKPWEVLMIHECGSDQTLGLAQCTSQVVKLEAQRDVAALTAFAKTAHAFYEILYAAHEEFGKQQIFDPIGNRWPIRRKLNEFVDAASRAARAAGLNFQFPMP